MGYSNALPKNPYLPALVSSSRISSRTCAAVRGASSPDGKLLASRSLAIITAFIDMLFLSAASINS